MVLVDARRIDEGARCDSDQGNRAADGWEGASRGIEPGGQTGPSDGARGHDEKPETGPKNRRLRARNRRGEEGIGANGAGEHQEEGVTAQRRAEAT